MIGLLRRFSRSSIPRRLRAVALLAFASAVLLISPLTRADGQALPTAERSIFPTFALPRVNGTLQFAVTASESVTSGYYSSDGEYAATSLSGDLAYISTSKTSPTSLVLTAGRSWSTSSQPSANFLNLSASQVFGVGRWHYVASDTFSYLPYTASTGLSGIPGTGDLGVNPVGTDLGQGVLTEDSDRISNSTSLSASRQLTGKTSLYASGGYTLLRFVGDSGVTEPDGIDNNNEVASAGLNHVIDARNTLGGSYGYSRFTYGANQQGFVSQSALLNYSHQFTRLLGLTLSVGPERSNTINAVGNDPTFNIAVSAALNYSARTTEYVLAYSRGTNNGSGVALGAHSDSVRFSAGRTFDRRWNVAVSSSYTTSTSLPGPGVLPFSSQTLVDAAQLSRALGRKMSLFASYTLENQSITGTAIALNVFSGLTKVAAVGLTYSPTSLHFGPR